MVITRKCGRIVPVARCLLAAALSAYAGLAFPATGYQLVELKTLGGTRSEGLSINNAGQVAGWSSTATGASHATLWNSVVATDLGTLGGSYSAARSINDDGLIVGYSKTASGHEHATFWYQGTAYDLGTIGGDNSSAAVINNAGIAAGSSEYRRFSATGYATVWDAGGASGYYGLSTSHSAAASGMNDAGVVVGDSYTSGSPAYRHATQWTTAGVFDLGVLAGGAESAATAINNAGDVAGWSEIACPAGVRCDRGGTAEHAVLWRNGLMTDLGTLAGVRMVDSRANAINESGMVVGHSSDDNGRTFATLWDSDGQAHNLQDLLDPAMTAAGWWRLDKAWDINDRGWIVAQAYNTEVDHALTVVLIPTAVPEPAQGAMLLAGLGLLGLFRRSPRA